jgi:hypothetical protein
MHDFHKTSESAFEFSHPGFQRDSLTVIEQNSKRSETGSCVDEEAKRVKERIKKLKNQQGHIVGVLQGLERQYESIVKENQRLVDELIFSRSDEGLNGLVKFIAEDGTANFTDNSEKIGDYATEYGVHLI